MGTNAGVQAILLIFTQSSWNYYKAYYGCILSYVIILIKSHPQPTLSKEYVARVLQDENTQYFLLALVWLFGAPIKGLVD